MKRILFLGPTYVGDAVVASGLIAHLAERHPKVQITLVCGRPAARVLTGMPGVVDVIAFDKRRRKLHWLDIWRAVAGRTWSWVIDLRASGIGYAVLARRRSVFAPKPESYGHRTTRWAHLAGLDEMPRPRLFPSPEQSAAAQALVPPGPPVIAFGPTANWMGKIWPIERFAELGDRLAAPDGPFPGARIAVIGAAGDRDDVAPLLAAVPADRRVDLVGTDLLTAYAALTRCTLYVGNDSGLLYISVAADVPAVGLVGPSLHLFGPERPPLVAPWAPKAAIARTPITYQEFITAEGYDHRTTGSLMGSLTVDAVESTVRALLMRLAP